MILSSCDIKYLKKISNETKLLLNVFKYDFIECFTAKWETVETINVITNTIAIVLLHKIYI